MKRKTYLFIFVIIYFLMLRYMLSILFPFLLSLLCFYIIKPLIDKIEKTLHLKRNVIGMTILLCVYVLFFLAIGLLVFQGVVYIGKLTPYLDEAYMIYIDPFIQKSLPIFNLFYEQGSQYLFETLSVISDYIQKIPYFLFSFLLFMISTFYIVLEYDLIKEKVMLVCPSSFFDLIIFMKENCLKSIFLYLKCQLLLMLLSFVMVLFVFYIFHYDHYFILACVTALLDSLPFIGLGIVFIPLSFYYLVQGLYLKAFYLFLIYMFMNVVRSVLEPHIMNKQMKIPSFLLLVSMVIHIYFFGFIGVILSPIHMNILFEYLQYHS